MQGAPSRPADIAMVPGLPAKRAVIAWGLLDWCLALAAGVAEAALFYALAWDIVNWPVVLLAHCGVVGALCLCVTYIARAGGNGAPTLLTTIAVAATGPLGAVIGLFVLAFSMASAGDQRQLAAWYERIANAVETDEVTRLCEQVSTGRTAALTGPAPASFTSIMQFGSIDDRQTTLGIIARNFHPDYLPALVLALKNSEPVIRVQAAAVATRVRGDLRALVDRHASGTSPPLEPGSGAALTVARQLDTAIASGLLDESCRIRATVIAGRLKARGAAPAHNKPIPAVPVVHRAAVEAMLISTGRFGQLRVGRRIAALQSAGLFYRVRRPNRADKAAGETGRSKRLARACA
jgi:hypothetical protein